MATAKAVCVVDCEEIVGNVLGAGEVKSAGWEQRDTKRLVTMFKTAFLEDALGEQKAGSFIQKIMSRIDDVWFAAGVNSGSNVSAEQRQRQVEPFSFFQISPLSSQAV